jgi:hypothetical protein
MTVKPSYITGRKTWARPQAMIWADAAPTVTENGELIPVGYELGSDTTGIPAEDLEQSFIILSDHNRSSIDIANERIEQRQRMANGTMRSFFIADKLTIDTSWSMLPSRGFEVVPSFDQDFGTPAILTPDNKGFPPPNTYFAHKSQQYTADGGAGGGELLEWYETHTGPFWVLLSYDKYANFGDDNSARQKLSQYSQAIQMYISDFNYSVAKRGGNNFDMWDVSVTLEEV